MKNIFCLILYLVCFNLYSQKIVDVDGNTYDTVIIGTQVWLKENLRVTHYRDGSAIPLDTGTINWQLPGYGARCYYNNDSLNHAQIYGALYNAAAVNDRRGLCPLGWHVPSQYAFHVLALNYGSSGGNLKDTGFVNWMSPNFEATNSTRFTALGAGYRNYDTLGAYLLMKQETRFWGSGNQFNYQEFSYLRFDKSNFGVGISLETFGCSVRCLRDLPVSTNNIESNQIFFYPNPASQVLFVPNENQFLRNIEIYSIAGNFLFQEKLYNQLNQIQINSLHPGIYIIKFKNESKTFYDKLIVQ